jgi:tetratricopeptide (TPR) repeat protein
VTTAEPRPAEVARLLQLELCVDRLLGHLFPDQEIRERPGRHQVLTEVVRHSPALRRALLDDDEGATLKAWTKCLAERGTDLSFHHTLAVLYRERALVGDESGSLLVFATALWALLLGTAEFWDRASERVLEQQSELATEVAEELFMLNATTGRQALADDRVDAAGPHVRCLVACRSGADRVLDILSEFGLPYEHTVDERLMGQVSDVATSVLDDWCADLVRAAEKTVADPDVIARLPDGISKNWEGGVAMLEPVVRAGVWMPRVLSTGLQWYVEWCFALNKQDEDDRIGTLLKSADLFVRPLVEVSVKGRGHLLENQVLSKYFMFRGFVEPKPAERERKFRRALAWNPNNSNAQELLDSARVGALVTKGLAAAGEKRYPEALALLQDALEIERDSTRQDHVRRQIADVHNQAGIDAVDEVGRIREKFVDALEEIVAAVKNGGRYDLVVSQLSAKGTGCAVCEPSSINRRLLIQQIVAEIRASGSFRVQSIMGFWRPQRIWLCASCQGLLDTVDQAMVRAGIEFRTAVEVDPDHPSAKANLATVEEMKNS